MSDKCVDIHKVHIFKIAVSWEEESKPWSVGRAFLQAQRGQCRSDGGCEWSGGDHLLRQPGRYWLYDISAWYYNFLKFTV